MPRRFHARCRLQTSEAFEYPVTEYAEDEDERSQQNALRKQNHRATVLFPRSLRCLMLMLSVDLA